MRRLVGLNQVNFQEKMAITRREFLKAAGRLGVVAAGAAATAACNRERPAAPAATAVVPAKTVEVPSVAPQTSPAETIKTEVTELPMPSPDIKGLCGEGKVHTQEIISRAHQFMGVEVPIKGERNDRTRAEVGLMSYLEENGAKAADTISALKACGTVEARCWGMQLLWLKRQSGELEQYGVMPLDQERMNWAIENNIDPRVLALCRDSMAAAIKLMQAAPDRFLQGVPEAERSQINYQDLLPNPGLMAKLCMTETGHAATNPQNPIDSYWGYVYIGDGKAWDEINPSIFPYDRDVLVTIATHLQEQTGLPYLDNVKLLPGSRRGDETNNTSGGAIGPQFMPGNAWVFMKWYSTANERLGNIYPNPNPFDPITGMIMAHLFIASEWGVAYVDEQGQEREVIRPGYRASRSEEEKKAALRKWNQWEPQVEEVMSAGYSYYDRFGRV